MRREDAPAHEADAAVPLDSLGGNLLCDLSSERGERQVKQRNDAARGQAGEREPAYPRRIQLGHGCLLGERLTGVLEPRSVHHQQTSSLRERDTSMSKLNTDDGQAERQTDLDVGRCVGVGELHALIRGDRVAELLARVNVGHRVVERACKQRQRRQPHNGGTQDTF